MMDWLKLIGLAAAWVILLAAAPYKWGPWVPRGAMSVDELTPEMLDEAPMLGETWLHYQLRVRGGLYRGSLPQTYRWWHY